MPFRKAVLSLAVLLIASAPLALAQGTYTQIDVPGELDTDCLGINTAGDIVGTYAAGYGFLLSGGTYTTIAYPGAESTTPFAINDKGQIVGYAEFSDASHVGFLYSVAAQSFTEIAYSSQNTVVTGINESGVMTGYYYSGEGSGIGFILDGSAWRFLGSSKYPRGITTSGAVAGNVESNGNELFMFTFDKGQYQRIQHPSEEFILLEGVNPAGDSFVGYYISNNLFYGFLCQNGSFSSLLFPGSNSTNANGINAAGVIVGQFQDASGIHGFTWTPPADAAKK
jgi:probable HAF family extracellular repeat protein